MPGWLTSAAQRLRDRDVLERERVRAEYAERLAGLLAEVRPGVYGHLLPDEVDLGLHPHCRCQSPVVFGHVPSCRLTGAGIRQSSFCATVSNLYRIPQEEPVPVTYMKHTETWNLDINREPGDEWPDMPVQYSAVRDAMFRPDLITVAIRRGGEVTFTVHGRRIRKDGTPGLNGTSSVRHTTEPQWAAGVVAAARAEHNLTEEVLSR